MRKIFLITVSILSSFIVNGQTLDSKEYLTDVTKDIITTIENGEDKEKAFDLIQASKSEIEYAHFLEDNFELNNEDNIQLSVRDIDHLTKVVTIRNKGKSFMKMVDEAAPMVQSDGTTVFYANSDKTVSSINAQVGVRVAVISINKR